jgi:hypothetical protein
MKAHNERDWSCTPLPASLLLTPYLPVDSDAGIANGA